MKNKKGIKRIFDAYCIVCGMYSVPVYDNIKSVCARLAISATQQDLVIAERLLRQYRIDGINPWDRPGIINNNNR